MRWHLLTNAALLGLCLLAASPAWAKKIPPATPVDLNRANAGELMKLPGIGRARAEAIVSHRAQHPFKRVEDVVRVKGLGKGWLSKNRQHLSIGTIEKAPTEKR
jgi:competence protein ComEA